MLPVARSFSWYEQLAASEPNSKISVKNTWSPAQACTATVTVVVFSSPRWLRAVMVCTVEAYSRAIDP